MVVKKTTKVSKPVVVSKSKGNEEKFNKMIQDRAYYIWEEKGRPEGRDFEIWLQAEKEIRAKIKK